ncbi:MAG: peroxide stress protein YaaA [Lachnospiraceae bacterium]
MRILLSPAKKMRVDTDTFPVTGMPVFLDRAEVLRNWIAGLTAEEQKKLWAAGDAITAASRALFEKMDLTRTLTPAILSYDGIQYTYLAPAVLEETSLSWLQEHVRILSGFYGVLRPFDGVVPYRLEMQAKGAPAGFRDLYDFWGDALYRAVSGEDSVILNLASKEYARAVEPYLRSGDRFVTCVFGEPAGEKILQKGVYAKMARGEMVRYLAECGAKHPEEAKGFAQSGYHFDAARSTDTTYVFVRTEIPGKGAKPQF